MLKTILFVCAHLLSAPEKPTAELDHVIIAVNNLQAAVQRFEGQGFAVKPGRQHRNGLLNAHIKLENGTELELMSLTSAPTDEIARGYRAFLEDGEGGAFLALRVNDPVIAKKQLRQHGFPHQLITGKWWDYIVFPPDSGLEHVFFFLPRKKLPVTPHTPHGNDVRHIVGSTIEGGNELKKLLMLFGANRCRESNLLQLGSLAIRLTGKQAGNRPRITAIAFDKPLSLEANDDIAHDIEHPLLYGVEFKAPAYYHCTQG